ncbi:hypothetical protein C4B68_01095 [Streptomyces dengpaensis]|uniref:Transposase IS4-like domain-containing protein n=1 Tax=Streptomyces dengpaensis TaxID=2049881 RepID=A0ABN5HVM7_9ACTN|nr:hypothetical protein C4B68_01095 [Streptomyces dengpaensis]
MLARRSITDPTKIAYYICYVPTVSRLKDLVRTAGPRWQVEECFQTAKGECGLDHYQVRLYRAWYRHITLAMAALAYLTAVRIAEATKGGSFSDDQDLIPLSVPEIRRMIGHLVTTPRHKNNDHHLRWSRFRRRSQARARRCHYKRRGHTHMRLQY